MISVLILSWNPSKQKHSVVRTGRFYFAVLSPVFSESLEKARKALNLQFAISILQIYYACN